jgi:hypothetical protein
MMTNLSLFPGFNNKYNKLGGEVRFNQIKSLFKSPKRQLDTSWDTYFSLIPDIRKLIRIVLENSSKITFCGNPSDITIDDDKWQFCSSNWAKLEYSRLGCVLNMACDCPTGLFVSGSMTQFGEIVVVIITNHSKHNVVKKWHFFTPVGLTGIRVFRKNTSSQHTYYLIVS